NNVFVPQAGVGQKVLSGLEGKINDLSGIVVEQGTEKLELVNKGGIWQVKKTGYPVSPAKVKQALVGLAEMTNLEAKTGNPKKFLLIDVDSPGQKDGRGRLFTLLGKDGKQVGRIVLGKTAVGKAGPGRDAEYVRVPGEASSWLVLGSVDAGTALPNWVEPRFLKLDVDSVTYGRVEFDGGKVEVRRTGKSATGSSQFELIDVPEGRKPRTSTTIKFTATDLVNLDLVDVRPLKADGKTTSTAYVETDSGLKLAFRLVEEYGKGWVSIKVVDKGKNVKAADAIIAKTKGWEFLIADYKKAAFKRRKEDLLEKPQ
ncbi:MAG TPA: DUF4340 domain-containing protein, partial [Rhizobiales bacterium]|nr:DUF4340 domain-containing protein [Hyphomicrobiales bacterium]